MKTVILAMMLLGLSGCLTVSDGVLCSETFEDRELLLDGLKAHPEAPEAVGEPAVNLLITLKVCEG